MVRSLDLDAAERRRLDEAGVLVRLGAYAEPELEALRAAFERLHTRAQGHTQTVDLGGARFVIAPTGESGAPRVQRVVWCGAAEPALEAVGADPRVLTPVMHILGTEAAEQLINQAHFKRPHDGVAFDMHQDAWNRRYGTPLWRDSSADGGYVQCVLTVDEMTADNGPLLYVPGSHRLGPLLGPDRDARVQEILRESPPEHLTAPAGALLFFGPFLLHGSTPNTSDGPRRILVNGYARPGVNRREYPGAGRGLLRHAPSQRVE